MKHLALTSMLALALAMPAFASEKPGEGKTVRVIMPTQIE